jgi:hypothetical protein
MAEMEEVAAAAGPLRGLALKRARTAAATRRKPLPFDVSQAMSDYDAIICR